jgi:putative drug exporter of the RND superfamily
LSLAAGGKPPGPVSTLPDLRPNTGFAARSFGRTVVALRWLIVPAWVAAAAIAFVQLPGISGLESAPLSGLVPADSPAMQAQARSQQLFSVPIVSALVVVARKEGGYSLTEQQKIVAFAEQARRTNRAVAAVPVINTLGLVPGSRERNTTAITYLIPEGDDPIELVANAEDYAKRLGALLPGSFTGVTGTLAARDAESDAINTALPWIEVATVLLIFFVLAFSFRSLGAPLITLFAAGVSFVIAERVVTWVANRFDLSVPREVEPLMLVLVLAVVTDYAVFFLAGTRSRLAGGARRPQAAWWTAAQYTPIITTAALIVALGAATILVGSLDFFRVFGPGLAVTVLIGVVVALTLVPALLGIFGRAAYWPGGVARGGIEDETERVGVRTRITGLVRHRPFAFVAVLVSLAALVAAATGLASTRLALAPVAGLDADAGPARAYEQAATGIVAPTEVVVESPGIAGQDGALGRLRQGLARQEGVAGVIGPGLLPPIGGVEDAFRSRSGNAVRYFVLFDEDPYSAHAVSLLDGLEQRLPALLDRAGLPRAHTLVAGDTAAARDAVGATHADLLRIGIAVVLVNLILLAIFLRSLVAPFYLVLASALALLAAVGLATLFFHDVLGYPDMTYYVPLAAGVLLVSLGADYNLFVVGRIWQESQRLPLKEAIGVAAPRASRAVTIAGLTLALSFGLLAIVPLAAFREFAFIMGVGALIDTFLVRTFLVPGLISLVGPVSWWPGVPREARS